MNSEERVNLVIDLVAEEILRQMREMQESAESEKTPTKPSKRWTSPERKIR